MIFKCVLAISIHSLTVKISHVPCTGEVVGFLSARNLGSVRPFLKCFVVKSFDTINFSGKNFKFAT